jgi:molybdopterin-containing oxidoreductase family iron-sulfur binding subunit
MRRHQWEPLHRDNEFAACQRAFGRPVERVFDVGSADVIFAVESDLISAVPGWLAYARQFAARRRPDQTGGNMSRVYAIESTPTLIGAKADHRVPMGPEEILDALRQLAAGVGAGPQEWTRPESRHASWLSAAAQDLMQHKGHALVHAGREQPVEVHLLADAINSALGAFEKTIRLVEPVVVSPVAHQQSLQELVGDMTADRVDTLLMLGTNPLYDAPADLDFAAALKRVPMSISLSLYPDETAEASTWLIPAAHEYEAWSDARAFEGTVTIQQPQVRRLYGGHSAQEMLAVLLADTSPDDYALLRGYWEQEVQKKGAGDFEDFWHESLRSGIVKDSAAAPVTVAPKFDLAGSLRPSNSAETEVAVLFRQDPLVWDGRFADNPWLLEMPRPFTRLTWDNAALIAPATAARLGIKTEDVLTITVKSENVRAPFFVLPGQAPDCIALPLGFGRRAGGARCRYWF